MRTAPTRHSERCPECKRRVNQLLERSYGRCLANHRFPWPANAVAYAGTAIQPVLQKVAAVLRANRGYRVEDFVKARTLAPCDFWVPDPGFVVEFDESQHFTYPRRSALIAYGDALPLGFSRRRWIELCEKHDAKDNDPPHRDEQRAWYDTLRDLVPPLEGHLPTVRLYARDLAWCALDVDRADDRTWFFETVLSIPGTAG